MAENNINIALKLKTELETARGDLESLRNEKGLKNKKAVRNLNEVEGLLNSLSSTDFSKLKGTDLTRILGQFTKVRELLDSASRTLTKFSTDYLNVVKKVEEANNRKIRAEDALLESTTKQQKALEKLNLGYEGTTYRNKAGHPLKNVDTILKNYRAGTLRVFNQDNVELQGAARTRRLQSVGLPEYDTTTLEVAAVKSELADATDALKKFKTVLENTNPGRGLHPTTGAVTQHSVSAFDTISNIKSQSTAETEKQIKSTTQNIDKITEGVDKQDSVFNKAFKRISLYAIV